MVEVNPLSFIGSSNDPTLAKRTVAADKGAIDLQNALGKIASQGQNTRANTALVNAGALNRAYVAKGFAGADDTGISKGPTSMENVRASDIDKNAAFSFNNRASGLNSLAKAGLGALFRSGDPFSSLTLPTTKMQRQTPTGTKAALAGNTAFTQATKKSTAGMQWNPKKKIFEKVKTEDSNSTKTKGGTSKPKSTISPRRAKELYPIIKKNLDDNGIRHDSFEILSQQAGAITISIDGGAPITFNTSSE
jgi:hypothetical protein